MAAKPLVYICHGAWHGPAHFEKVKVELQSLGYTMLCSRYPSTGGPPTMTLYDDAAHVRAELEVLIETGQEVVLVMHSYGGMVGTQAAAGLGKAEREKQGLSGGIVSALRDEPTTEGLSASNGELAAHIAD
jgi:pimeloyl-ACP methyl ester carboxylesterase